MRVLLDTNVVLDVLLNRAPWAAEASALWEAHDAGRLQGYVTATTLTNIFYIARRAAGLEKAQAAVRLCLQTFELCPVDRVTLERAAQFSGPDFEDNLQIACAEISGLAIIVTRNLPDYAHSGIRPVTPATLLSEIN